MIWKYNVRICILCNILCTVQLIRDIRVATIRDTARQTFFRPFWMAGLAVARHRHDIMWLSRHGVVGTASRQVPNVCRQIVYTCRTMSGRPDMAWRIFTHLNQIMYKFPEVIRPYQPSRQVATRYSLFVQNVCRKCLDLSGHTGRRGRSETTCRDRPRHRLTKVSVPAMSCL